MNYSRKLKFEEKPDYQQLITMFRELFVRETFEFDYMYDWILKKQAMKQRLAASTRGNRQLEEEEQEEAKKGLATQQSNYRVVAIPPKAANEAAKLQPNYPVAAWEAPKAVENSLPKYLSTRQIEPTMHTGQTSKNQFYASNQNQHNNSALQSNVKRRMEFKSSAQQMLSNEQAGGVVPLARQHHKTNLRVSSSLNPREQLPSEFTTPYSNLR